MYQKRYYVGTSDIENLFQKSYCNSNLSVEELCKSIKDLAEFCLYTFDNSFNL